MPERADINITNTDERRFQMSLEKKMPGRPAKIERPQTTDVRIAKNPAMNNRKVLENIHRGNPGRAVVPQRLPNLPKVLQRRVIMTPPAPPARPPLSAPLAKCPNPPNRLWPKTDRALKVFPSIPSTAKPAPVQRRGINSLVQRFSSTVVQAVKFYPNLHPGAVEQVEPSSIFKLDSFANQYRLRRVNSHSVNVPNQQYNFVRTRDGEMLLHARYRHPSIAEGKQVLYAGEIFFNNGQLEWWSNGSGHYQPYVEDAEQASLPMGQFFSYQQVIKGEHKRKS